MRILALDEGEVHVLPDGNALARAAADEFQRQATAAIDAHGRFTVALSGGSTPKGVYALLAKDESSGARKLPWNRIHVFFGDERHVPPDHPDSNYRMACESLLAHVPIPADNMYRMPAELHAPEAADQYAETLRSFFRPAPGAFPRFDLVMLGLGLDGHTASLFPDTAALRESSRLVCANWVEKFHNYRLTLTFPVINAAAEIMFVVAGAEKASILQQVLQSEAAEGQFPAQRVRPADGRLLWMVDAAAAREIIPPAL